jgi:hypothetical protein
MNSSIREFFKEIPWTWDFKNQVVPNLDDEQLGNWIVYNSGWPYLPLDLPYAPYKEMLKEALALKDFFVIHRSPDSLGWRSLCIYGEEWDKTDHYTAYPENAGKQMHEIQYKWTKVADLCPVTTKYFKEEFVHTPGQRIRFMWLDPQGYILPHRDRKEHFLSPVNIALNNPNGCIFNMEGKGYVPFEEKGNSCLVDIGNLHSVWNNSNTPRIHIISHGSTKPFFNKLVAQSFKKLINNL